MMVIILKAFHMMMLISYQNSKFIIIFGFLKFSLVTRLIIYLFVYTITIIWLVYYLCIVVDTYSVL
jgi:hypothetical protein